MAVFISVSTDAFSERFRQAQTRQPQIDVRRPLRGIQVKPDTYAVIRVQRATGEEIPLFNSSVADSGDGVGRASTTSNFLLQQIQEMRMEKSQIVETFGEDYIFFFGERPVFLQIQGTLLNTTDFDWKNEFWLNYEKYFRGTRLVELNARIYLYFDDVVLEGYMTQATSSYASDNPNSLPFNFQLFITNYAILSNVGSVFFQDGAEIQPLPPPTEEAKKKAAANASQIGSSGGLNSFLAQTQKYMNDASIPLQKALAEIRNTLHGKRLVWPQSLSEQLSVFPVGNQASFEPGPVNQPIHTMYDEYVERGDREPQYDQAEISRVRDALKLRSPAELEKEARAFLQKLGVDATRREDGYLLLGKAAYVGAQVIGTFGVRQLDGNLALDGVAGLENL